MNGPICLGGKLTTATISLPTRSSPLYKSVIWADDFLMPILSPKIDCQSIGRFSCLRKLLGRQNRADPQLDFFKILSANLQHQLPPAAAQESVAFASPWIVRRLIASAAASLLGPFDQRAPNTAAHHFRRYEHSFEFRCFGTQDLKSIAARDFLFDCTDPEGMICRADLSFGSR